MELSVSVVSEDSSSDDQGDTDDVDDEEGTTKLFKLGEPSYEFYLVHKSVKLIAWNVCDSC